MADKKMRDSKRISFRWQLVVKIGFYLVVGILIVNPSFFTSLTGRNCDASSPRPILDNTLNSKHLWTVCTGISSESRSMLIFNNYLILGDYTRGAMVAFDLESGTIKWSSPMQGVGSLIVDRLRERIYTFTIYGALREIFAIDANTGDVVWYNGEQNGQHDGYSPILLADGQLIAHATLSRRNRVLDADTGKLGEDIAVASLDVYPTNGYAWYILNNYLLAVNALSGDVYWRATQPVPKSCCMWDLQINDRVVLAKLGDDLAAYDFETGRSLWNTTDLHMVGYSALTSDTVYVLDLGARLHVMDSVSGTEEGIIQFEPAAPGHDTDLFSSDSISSSMVVADNGIVAIYFGDTDQLSIFQIEKN